jgi:choline dehydrogenase-like flavoprotein
MPDDRGNAQQPRPQHADVLIIGAGASGSVAAKRLGEEGVRVVCLEQGGWPDYDKARADKPDYELLAGRDWDWNPITRKWPGDYPIDESESDITPLMFNGVGGGSVMYAAHWQRSMPSDFRVKTLDGVGDDWPLTYQDLKPFYERVEIDMGISGLDGDTAFPPGPGWPLPPSPLGVAGKLVAAAHNRLGWHWWPGPNAIATRETKHLKACARRGTCLWGCNEKAKGSFDLTHWPDALAAGVELRTRSRVRRLLVGDDGRITGAEFVDSQGNELVQTADVTLLCANGIGTPRLLLASATDRYPNGLANSTGLVGKRLMMHPFSTVLGVFEEDLRSWEGPWGQSIHSLEFYETDASRGFVRGAKWGLQPSGGPVSMTKAYPFGDNPIWGEGFHAGIRKRLGHTAMWGIIAEDLPDERNRVELHPELRDAHGVPAAKVIYKADENSERLVAYHQARAAESLEAAGAYEVIIAPFIRQTGWHTLGTAVMGDDPRTAVVDGFGRAYDHPNLFILDGSIFPTSTGMNPTATIAAMALRNTEHLIATRRNQEVAR